MSSISGVFETDRHSMGIIDMTQSETFTIPVSVWDDNHNPIDLTNVLQITFKVSMNNGITMGNKHDSIVSLSLGNNIELDTVNKNVFYINLTTSDTSNMVGNLRFQCFITDADNNDYLILKGQFQSDMKIQ